MGQNVTIGTPVEVRLNRELDNERAMATILAYAATDDDLITIMQRALEQVLAVEWLPVHQKGGLFLTGPKEVLELVAQVGLSEPLLSTCARVEFGTCLCGRAAQSRQLVHASCVDHRHEHVFPAMADHGHYNVPILDGENVLGVIVLYLEPGHQAQEEEQAFLLAVANILSLVIRHRRVHEELAASVEALRTLADTDVLTGLPNRRSFFSSMEDHWHETRTVGTPLSVVMLDIDHFKAVNDTHGHQTGDAVLIEIASRIRSEAGEFGLPSRWGGEEFVIAYPDLTLDAAGVAAERLRSGIARLRPAGLVVTASLGVAQASSRDSSFDHLLQRADDELYAAKAAGRDTVMLAR